MAAIVRVKRRRSEDPVESLLISCKKRKEEDATPNTQSAELRGLLKFAGTLHEKDTNVSTYIREAIKKEKLQKEYKSHSLNYENRALKHRQHQKQQSQSNRYKVVASHRAALLDRLDSIESDGRIPGTGNTNSAQTSHHNGDSTTSLGVDGSSESNSTSDNSAGDYASEKVFCLYDVEEEPPDSVTENNTTTPVSAYSNITCNNVPMVRETVPQPVPSEEDYVYDLYYTNSQQIDFRMLEDILTITAFGEDLVFADSRAEEDEFAEVYEDEDDSNDEGNWRNDYPDEDPRFFENHDHDYYYGDDDVGHHRYNTEDPLASYMAASCNIRDRTNDGSWSQYDVISGPERSYESYYRAMLQDLGEDADESDSEEDCDVR